MRRRIHGANNKCRLLPVKAREWQIGGWGETVLILLQSKLTLSFIFKEQILEALGIEGLTTSLLLILITMGIYSAEINRKQRISHSDRTALKSTLGTK